MNKSHYFFILSLVALSSSLYSAEIADIPKKQVVLSPHVAACLKSMPPLAPHTKEWLNSKEALDYRIHYASGYHTPYIVDLAVSEGSFQQIAEFLAAGADVNVTDSHGNTAITRSLTKPIQCQLLLDYHADPNALMARSIPMLNDCCRYYDGGRYSESLCVLLSDPRIEVNVYDDKGYTPLAILVCKLTEEHLPYIKRLIECGANPCYTMPGGKNVFDVLVSRAQDLKQVSVAQAALKLFDDQRKAEGTWPKEGILPTIKECTVLSPDPASIVAEYAAPPAFVSDPDYHKELDTAIEAVAKSSAAS